MHHWLNDDATASEEASSIFGTKKNIVFLWLQHVTTHKRNLLSFLGLQPLEIKVLPGELKELYTFKHLMLDRYPSKQLKG